MTSHLPVDPRTPPDRREGEHREGYHVEGDQREAAQGGARLDGDPDNRDLARVEGDRARAQGDGARAQGDGARAHGDRARAPGDRARARGAGARAHGDRARAPGDRPPAPVPASPGPDAAPAIAIVRDATPADIQAIQAVAGAAWRATYAGRLSDESIERFIAGAHSAERVAVRIERHRVLVAASRAGGPVEAFLEIAERADHVQLVAVYAHPDVRGRGLGTALLDRARALHPHDHLAADVLVDNELAEPFYRARGFQPGELLTDEIAGEMIRERRWWLRAAPESRPPGG